MGVYGGAGLSGNISHGEAPKTSIDTSIYGELDLGPLGASANLNKCHNLDSWSLSGSLDNVHIQARGPGGAGGILGGQVTATLGSPTAGTVVDWLGQLFSDMVDGEGDGG